MPVRALFILAFASKRKGFVTTPTVRIPISLDSPAITVYLPERVYDSLFAAMNGTGEKCIKDEEVVRVLEILEEATAAAKESHRRYG